MSASSASPIGLTGRVSRHGAIRPGRVGEVMVEIRGGVEAFLARDADGGAIAPYAAVVVVDYQPPRLVLVTPLTEES
jgi:hypothetical protein